MKTIIVGLFIGAILGAILVSQPKLSWHCPDCGYTLRFGKGQCVTYCKECGIHIILYRGRLFHKSGAK